MHRLKVIHQTLGDKPLSHNLAELLFDRALYGKTVVVTGRPHVLHSTIRKRWQHLIRRLQIEQARTLNKSSKHNLSSQLLLAENTHFSSQVPSDYELDANITFLSADDCVRIAPACCTLCVTYNFPKEKLYMMTSWMPRGGLVVIYG